MGGKIKGNYAYHSEQFSQTRHKNFKWSDAASLPSNFLRKLYLISLFGNYSAYFLGRKQVEEYNDAYMELYPAQGLTKTTVTNAIALFEDSLLTPNSRFDQYFRGNIDTLHKDERKGYVLFKQNSSCHFGPVLGGLSYEKVGVQRNYFEMRSGNLTTVDNGRFNVTGKESDRHFFKVPVLRNIELTYPYFHDGSIKDLSQAVRIMGSVQVNKDFTEDEISNIVAFLKTLTGEYNGLSLSLLKDQEAGNH